MPLSFPLAKNNNWKITTNTQNTRQTPQPPKPSRKAFLTTETPKQAQQITLPKTSGYQLKKTDRPWALALALPSRTAVHCAVPNLRGAPLALVDGVLLALVTSPPPRLSGGGWDGWGVPSFHLSCLLHKGKVEPYMEFKGSPPSPDSIFKGLGLPHPTRTSAITLLELRATVVLLYGTKLLL